uniref:Uncharacterized protein n=1 Tax=Anopheles atroparvus TaxID=41427 RepID=A0A2C9GSP5_ANOAO
MNFAYLLFLVFAMVGLLGSMVEAQKPCGPSARVRCNTHCKSLSQVPYCVDDKCTCLDEVEK